MRSNFKKISFLLLLLPTLALASGGKNLRQADINSFDRKSLQNGARIFVNYCLGCHSLKFMRFNRLVKELDLTKEEVEENLMFVGDKIYGYMNNAIPNEDSIGWFGRIPPDLSLTARARGVDWTYTYLTSFYADSDRPTGVNNLIFDKVGMPHVLWELQGLQDKVKDGKDANGHDKFKLVLREGSGSMSKEEYDNTMLDLVNFMAYVAEPIKNERINLGLWVIGFLLILLVLTYLLKKEYWRDIH